MAHSEICPVCKGKGKVKDPENIEHSDIPCHGCDGKGWITVEDQGGPVYVPPIWPQPYYPSPNYIPYYYEPYRWEYQPTYMDLHNLRKQGGST